MHKYKIEVITLSETGAVGDIFKTIYADNEEQAELAVNQYVNKKQPVHDAEGNETGTLVNAYKVNLMVLVYKMIADKSAFFKNFKA